MNTTTTTGLDDTLASGLIAVLLSLLITASFDGMENLPPPADPTDAALALGTTASTVR